MKKIDNFKIKFFADGADLKDFRKLSKNRLVSGFTTNPSLMRKSGIKNYLSFAKKVLKLIRVKPVSFEIFADDIKEIEKQALKISKLGKNVFVKIPIINTKKKSNAKLIAKLNKQGVKINVTAVFTLKQTTSLFKLISGKTEIIISVFAGRIADTGLDAQFEMKKHLVKCKTKRNIKILWASVREVYNLVEAENIGCHIITVPPSILSKTKNFNKNLENYSQETVKMFFDDAKKSGYSL
ncbi:transaldolase [Candidatus Pelagibacter sp.]|nr:transaldolase [Candidatus Pelagibacter sp.]